MSLITSISRTTFEQERQDEANYWASKSIAERVKAGWDLAEDDLFHRKPEQSRRSEQLLLFSALNAANVEYAVVGGMAVNAHGYIRNTSDLNIYIRPTIPNAEATFRALSALGAPLDGMASSDLLVDYAHYKCNTQHGRIELLTGIGGMSFDQVWNGRVDEEIEGTLVHFISKQDPIENKLQVGRLRDLADVEELERLPEQPRLRLVDEARDVER